VQDQSASASAQRQAFLRVEASARGLCAKPLRPEPRNELTPSHSTTSSALSRIDDGTSRPSAFAVLRLIAMLNLVGR